MIATVATQALQGIRPFIEQQMKLWNVPGLAVAVIKDQEVLLAEGYGYRDVEAGLEVTRETLFAIGSTTKAFTAMAAGMLVDEGKLELDTPVQRYLPQFKMADAIASERATLRDLLCHRTGLPRHDVLWYNAPLTREALIERLPYLEMNKDFRAGWQYQNIMYMVAGVVIGQQLGTSWEDAVQEKIFNPLQMYASNFSVETSRKQSNVAWPYKDQGDQPQRIPFRNIDLIGPAGSINSNIEDMAKWVMLHLGKGAYQGKRIVSEKILAEMHKPHMPTESWITPETPMSCYGLGWGIEPYRGHQMIYHDGGIDGFTAEVSFAPDDQIGVVILVNKNGSPLPKILRHNLFDRLFGLDEIDWSSRMRGPVNTQDQGESQADDVDKVQEETDATVSTSPSTNSLHNYIGTYEHPGYGELVVTLSDENLQVVYNALQLPLIHQKDHAFLMDYKPFEYKTPATFQVDVNNQIDSVSIKMLLEPGTSEIVFLKK